METYDPDFLEEIKENVNLIEYASESFILKKRGRDYYTNCPKHVDRTPSLCFYADGRSYRCFSCGVNGDIIQFLRDFEDCTFAEAVEKAAKLADVDVKMTCHSSTISFLKKLKARADRKPKEVTHTPLDPKELEKYSRQKAVMWENEGISADVMDLFGVRIDGGGNRIVYPVYTKDGTLINIKGRTMYKNYKALHIPKYINYFSVGTLDYFQGMNITLPDILKTNEVIIFESVKSVMKCYGWGYTNCVSAETHDLSDEQINLLINLKADVVLAFDVDVDYYHGRIKENISELKKFVNLYIVRDPFRLLGGAETKNSPADCGRNIWEQLYKNRKRVV